MSAQLANTPAQQPAATAADGGRVTLMRPTYQHSMHAGGQQCRTQLSTEMRVQAMHTYITHSPAEYFG
jgi:hypothetical protein